MASSGERTHYQVLGVAATASPEQVRRAHRQLALVLHPDRVAMSTPAERALAERRMREVNAAWTTLSDPKRRADYDRLLAGAASPQGVRRADPGASAPPRPRRPEETADPDLAFARMRAAEIDPHEPELSPLYFWLLRRGPVVAMVLVALVLFVVTAYAGGNAATSDDDAAPATTLATAGCVRYVDGRTSIWVSCGLANDGRVVTFVDAPLECPSGTSYVVISNRVGCVTKDPALRSDMPPTTQE